MAIFEVALSSTLPTSADLGARRCRNRLPVGTPATHTKKSPLIADKSNNPAIGITLLHYASRKFIESLGKNIFALDIGKGKRKKLPPLIIGKHPNQLISFLPSLSNPEQNPAITAHSKFAANSFGTSPGFCLPAISTLSSEIAHANPSN